MHKHALPRGQVGVAGPSGSGKTAFSEKVKTLMPGVALISMGEEAGMTRLHTSCNAIQDVDACNDTTNTWF
jgi:hypothetical protein